MDDPLKPYHHLLLLPSKLERLSTVAVMWGLVVGFLISSDSVLRMAYIRGVR